MGYLQDLAAGSNHISPSKPRSGLDRATAQALLTKGELTGNLPIGAAYAAASEVSTVDQLTGTPSGGTYDITVNFTALDISYTAASIAYNATAATIESALDTASPPAIADGDVAVSESGSAGLSDGTATFTCATTAANTPCLISVDNTSVTGIGGAQTTTRDTAGQSDRENTQAMYEMNIVTGTLQGSGEAPSWTKPEMVGIARPGTYAIRALAWGASEEDGTLDTYNAVAALYPQITEL